MKIFVVNRGEKVLFDQKQGEFSAREISRIKHIVKWYFDFEPHVEKIKDDIFIFNRQKIDELRKTFFSSSRG